MCKKLPVSSCLVWQAFDEWGIFCPEANCHSKIAVLVLLSCFLKSMQKAVCDISNVSKHI